MVFKSTGSVSRFQCKYQLWKICTESPDTTKKVSKIGLSNQTSKIWHILADFDDHSGKDGTYLCGSLPPMCIVWQKNYQHFNKIKKMSHQCQVCVVGYWGRILRSFYPFYFWGLKAQNTLCWLIIYDKNKTLNPFPPLQDWFLHMYNIRCLSK